MKCKISCSFGEIVDKFTILKIKVKKAQNLEAKHNIQNEINAICSENESVNNDDNLFNELYKVNNKLWILEDLIRNKSKKKEFDKEYISYAEKIHITNDERYSIKREINEKYDSYFKEEKIYPKYNKVEEKKIYIQVEKKHYMELEYGKKYYTIGNYKKSLEILRNLWNQFKENEPNTFYVDLVFSYSNILSIYGDYSTVTTYSHNIINNLDNLNISDELKKHVKSIYATCQLQQENYENAYPYINRLNNITGPGVTADNMSFFETYDNNKTLLVYDGGGLGDTFMFSRFIPILCSKYVNNKIIFFLDDCLFWFFQKMQSDYDNLELIKYTESSKISHFDYHCSFMYLIKELKITYNTLEFTPLFRHIGEYKKDNKIKYILNWKGNPNNVQEKTNRRMDLKYAIELFKIPNINWCVIAQNISQEEQQILFRNNVEYFKNIDKGTNCFEDSVSIIKSCSGVISTDTSIVHLSLNLGVPTYVLLTLGHEWRWGTNSTTNWYPEAILMKQKEQGNWEEVIQNLECILKEKHNIN